MGLAQLRKLDFIIEKQRANKGTIKKALAEIPGITFRDVPDEEGDSATFLSFFLPNESTARKVTKELGEAGVDGCFYWYDNNWHYLRNWPHLKQLKAPFQLAQQQFENAPDYERVELPASDAIMSRLVSMLIKLSWTENEISERIEKMTTVFKRNL